MVIYMGTVTRRERERDRERSCEGVPKSKVAFLNVPEYN